MTNIDIVENKISAVKKYLSICERYKHFSQKEIEADIDKQGMVERYLFLAVQSAIDLAESYIAYSGYRKPTTMSEAFKLLEEEKIISKDLKEKMVAMTGFRNIITHDYERLDYDIVYNVLQKGLLDIKSLIDSLKF